MKNSVLFWYHQISWRATVPSQYFMGFFNGAALWNSFQEPFLPWWALFSSGLAPPMLALTVPPLLSFVPAAGSGMTWAISPPPAAFLLPASSSPTLPAREEHQEPLPLLTPAALSSPATPSYTPSGHNLCSGYAGMEKQPISGLGEHFRRHMIFLFYLV